MPLGLEWSALHKAARGHRLCGDLCLVEPRGSGWLLAVADGAGQGIPAAQAAARCLDALRGGGSDPGTLFARAHAAARESRGAALALAMLDAVAHTLTWCAVGDVTGWLGRPGTRQASGSGRLLKQPGTVGHRMPRLIPRCFDVNPGDRLVVHTDGLDSFPDSMVRVPLPPAALADRLLESAPHGRDDRLVLVADLCGA